MIEVSKKKFIIEHASELPEIRNHRELFLDFETTSHGIKKAGLSPWKGGQICGAALTYDDCSNSWYIPVRHKRGQNIPLESFQRWLHDLINQSADWVNQNVKFDAHFAAAEGAIFGGRLVDTLTLAKTLDTDQLGGFDLTSLMKKYCNVDIGIYEYRLKKYLGRIVDYADVPIDVLGEYACVDVLSARAIWRRIQKIRPAELERVWDMEIKTTPILFDIEQRGLGIDLKELKIAEFTLLNQILKIEQQLIDRVGTYLNPSSNDDCFDYLCNSNGLPILSYTDRGQPSFDKFALQGYMEHPDVVHNPGLQETVATLLKYRKLSVLLKTFVKPYIIEQFDQVLHPSYNQLVRTGRMSSKMPNAQQLSTSAKKLIHPRGDNVLMSYDYSQMEFRIICHYIECVEAITTYQKNPRTDFHQWVADMCGIPRKPAKNINFAIAFGAGKNRIIKMLASNAELTQKIYEKIADDKHRDILVKKACEARGEEVFAKYHSVLSTLRKTSREASQVIRLRGFVRNAYGRHRHIPVDKNYIAFNSVIQGTAADVLKDRLCAVSPRYNPKIRAMGIDLVALVHDEILFEGPKISDEESLMIAGILQKPEVKFSVPLLVDGSWGEKNWAQAGSGEQPLSC